MNRFPVVLSSLEKNPPLPNDLSKAQWRELLYDMAVCGAVVRAGIYPDTASSKRLYAVFPQIHGSRSDIVVDIVLDTEELLPVARKRLCEALDELVSELLDDIPFEKPYLLELLVLGSMFGLDGELAMRIANDDEMDIDVRTGAAAALLDRDFRNSAPFNFWDQINLGAFPTFLPFVMAACNQIDMHTRGIRKINQVPRKPKDVSMTGMQYPLKEAIENTLACVNGEVLLVEILSGLPKWCHKDVRETLNILCKISQDQRHTLLQAL